MARVLLSCLAFSAVSWGYSTGYSYGSSAVSSGTRFEQDLAKYPVAIARFCNTKTCECGKYSKKWLELRKKINCAKNVLMEVDCSTSTGAKICDAYLSEEEKSTGTFIYYRNGQELQRDTTKWHYKRQAITKLITAISKIRVAPPKNLVTAEEAAKIKTISGYEYAMIKFCTPSCSDCKGMKKYWDAAQAKVNTRLGFSQTMTTIDCMDDLATCKRKMQVAQTPTIKVYKRGVFQGFYCGGWKTEDFLAFMDRPSYNLMSLKPCGAKTPGCGKKVETDCNGGCDGGCSGGNCGSSCDKPCAGKSCGQSPCEASEESPCETGGCNQASPCEQGNCDQRTPCEQGNCDQVSPCEQGNCDQRTPCETGGCDSPCGSSPCEQRSPCETGGCDQRSPCEQGNCDQVSPCEQGNCEQRTPCETGGCQTGGCETGDCQTGGCQSGNCY